MPENLEFNPASDLRGILSAVKAAEKTAVVHLTSGASLEGKIKDIGTGGLVLTQLSGRSFFDAFILLSAIVAVEAQVRG